MGFRDLLARVRGNTPEGEAMGAEEPSIASAPPETASRDFVPLQACETPTPEYFREEALYAHDLLDKALRVESLTEALPYLREFQGLTTKSKQKEIYDASAVQRVLAERALARVRQTSPGSILINPPSGTQTLEEAIVDVIFEMQEAGNGLMDPATTQRMALSAAYGDIMSKLASLVAENIKDIAAVDIPHLVSDYEKARREYLHHEFSEIPTISLEQEGRTVWRTTDRVVYRGANLYYTNLAGHLVANAHPLNARSADFSAEIERILEKVEAYTPHCEYDDGKREALAKRMESIRADVRQKAQRGDEMAEAIEARHDQLYDRFCEADSLYKARIIFDHFTGMSITYSSILDIEDLEATLSQGRKKLAEFDATLDEEDGGQFVIRKAGKEDYTLTIRKTAEQPTLPLIQLSSPRPAIDYDTLLQRVVESLSNPLMDVDLTPYK